MQQMVVVLFDGPSRVNNNRHYSLTYSRCTDSYKTYSHVRSPYFCAIPTLGLKNLGLRTPDSRLHDLWCETCLFNSDISVFNGWILMKLATK